MTTTDSQSRVIEELAMAEAAAWLSRLQNSQCTTDKAAFNEWLADNPSHRRAFAAISDIWDLIPGAVASTSRASKTAHAPMRRRRNSWLFAAACTAAFLVFALAAALLGNNGQRVYQTAAGERQTITLPDNTRITLNADTRISVDYRKRERRVFLEHGEALFSVATNSQRPFVLQTGGQRIVDLGTVFDASHYSDNVTVTLLEGMVSVTALKSAPGEPAPSTTLRPGERLSVGPDGVRVVDRPDLDGVTAWRHGRIYFDNVTLADAIATLNRYGGVQLRLADPSLASLRVSGEFSDHDAAKFASAMRALHALHTKQEGGVIVIHR